MLASINWRLVFRNVIPAVYIPLATFICLAILVAMTGLGTHQYVNEMGCLVASSSFVLVFGTQPYSDERRVVWSDQSVDAASVQWI